MNEVYAVVSVFITSWLSQTDLDHGLNRLVKPLQAQRHSAVFVLRQNSDV